jgi:hypothetical protein
LAPFSFLLVELGQMLGFLQLWTTATPAGVITFLKVSS